MPVSALAAPKLLSELLSESATPLSRSASPPLTTLSRVRVDTSTDPPTLSQQPTLKSHMAPRRNRRGALVAQGAALAALAAGASASSSAASATVQLTAGPGADRSALRTALPRCLGVAGVAEVGADG